MRSRRIIMAIVGLGILVAMAGLFFRQARADAGPAGKAEWIWADQRGDSGTPTAFVAYRDFDLDFEPQEAQLWVIADESYHLGVNGRGIAAGRYRLGDPLDLYGVGAVLREGPNRVHLELSSGRGAGGCLLRLLVKGVGGEVFEMVTDGSWRVLRAYDREALQDGKAPEFTEEPKVWGPQPAGRWGRVTESKRAPTLRELQPRGRASFVNPLLWRSGSSEWLELGSSAGEVLGAWTSFDFGREVVGFLNLQFANEQPSNAFVYYNLRLPEEGLPQGDDVVVRLRGRNRWTSTDPVRFRYVTVVGAQSLDFAEVIEADPAAVEVLAERTSPGLFGLEKPKTLVSPVEDEVRSKLEGVSGFTGRKES